MRHRRTSVCNCQFQAALLRVVCAHACVQPGLEAAHRVDWLWHRLALDGCVSARSDWHDAQLLGAVNIYAHNYSTVPDELQSFGMRSLLSAPGWKTVPSLAVLALLPLVSCSGNPSDFRASRRCTSG